VLQPKKSHREAPYSQKRSTKNCDYSFLWAKCHR